MTFREKEGESAWGRMDVSLRKCVCVRERDIYYMNMRPTLDVVTPIFQITTYL